MTLEQIKTDAILKARNAYLSADTASDRFSASLSLTVVSNKPLGAFETECHEVARASYNLALKAEQARILLSEFRLPQSGEVVHH